MSKKNEATTPSFLTQDEQSGSQLAKHKLGDYKAFVALFNFATGVKLKLFGAMILIACSSILALVSARFMGTLVEFGISTKNVTNCLTYASAIIILEILSLALLWYGRKILTYHASQVIFNIRKKLFTHLNMLPISYYDRQPQGRIVTRITHDVEGIEEFFTSSLSRFFFAILMTIMSGFAMLFTDFKMGGILILAMIPAIIFVLKTKKISRNVTRAISKKSSALNARLSEDISGMEVIRCFGLEQWSKNNFNNQGLEYLNATLSANKVFSFIRPLVAFFCSLPLIALLWFGGTRVISGALSVGIFVAFIRYCERFIHPIMTLARELHVVQQAFTGAERVMSFLNEHPEEITLGEDGHIDEEVLQKVYDTTLMGKLEFKNVSMYYKQNEWILKNLSFSINCGEKVGLIGKTGCGKTTLVSLISRIYDYQEGEIYLDGRSLKSYKRAYLRDKIGFVSQDVIIFKGNIRNNLILGKEVSDEAIIAACKQTGLLTIMQNKSQNLNSLVLEDGNNLSVGERQLMALTRVLIKNPKILILDEATSNIDPGYEQIIKEAISFIMKNRTCIIIAHRPSSIKDCSKILTFERDKVRFCESNVF
ncbi:MAG: ABC transporter ATP-binding protein [Bacteriovoracaceae bacterium]|nr:ABC transporter ATP-binding protein [Bacteriovoracaceae bacterium]